MADVRDPGAIGLAAGRQPAGVDLASMAALFLTAAAGVSAVIFISGVLARLGVTPDFPWLRAAGNWILEHRSLPATDPFSWTGGERPWVLYQWGYEVAVAAASAAIGHAGLVVLSAWITLALYLLIPMRLLRESAPLQLVVGVSAVGLGILTVNLSLRPMIATTAGLLLQHALIARLRSGRLPLDRACLWIALLYALWANLHTGFMLGFASLGLVLIGDFAERRWPSARRAEGAPALAPKAVAALLAAGLAGSLVNPYGIGVHRYILALSSDSYLNLHIDELIGANFSFLQFKLMLALLVALIAGLMRAPKALRPADLLHLTVITLATILAARFVVWAVLYYVLLLPIVIARAWPSSAEARFCRGDRPLSIILVLVSLLAAPVLVARGFIDPVGPTCRTLKAAFDAYLTDRRASDRLLTDPISGSCLIAALPGVPVFIDTRFDFYGSDFLQRVLPTLRLQPGWRTLLDERRIDVAILDRSWPLAQAITQDGRFVTVHEDANAVVVRRAP